MSVVFRNRDVVRGDSGVVRGGSGIILRSRRDGVSVRVRPRSVVACGLLLIALAVAAVATLTTGDYPLSAFEAIRALFGTGDPASEFIVTALRLPRLLTAVGVGAALGCSGAILQSLSNNPLASPDIIGFTTGSATGGIIALVVFGGGMATTALGAVAGGIATSVAVYVLALRHGGRGLRLILVGIGVGSVLMSLNSYLISRASLTDALAAQAWLVGGLNGRGWEHVWPVGLALALLFPLASYHGGRLALLRMGDDMARALGVNVERSRLALAAVSVALAAVATAAAGPIAFVALAAPQVARGLTRAHGPGLLVSAVVGGLLLVLSDLLVQRVFAPTVLPVGIATGALGGMYLVWLLVREWRGGRS